MLVQSGSCLISERLEGLSDVIDLRRSRLTSRCEELEVECCATEPASKKSVAVEPVELEGA